MTNRHPHADVIHAYAEGAEVEFKPSSAALWTPVPRPCFNPTLQYRVKLSSPQLPLPLDEQTDDAGGVCTVC